MVGKDGRDQPLYDLARNLDIRAVRARRTEAFDSSQRVVNPRTGKLAGDFLPREAGHGPALERTLEEAQAFAGGDPLHPARNVLGFRVAIGGAYSDIHRDVCATQCRRELSPRTGEVAPAPRAHIGREFHEDYEVQVAIRTCASVHARTDHHHALNVPTPQHRNGSADLRSKHSVACRCHFPVCATYGLMGDSVECAPGVQLSWIPRHGCRSRGRADRCAAPGWNHLGWSPVEHLPRSTCHGREIRPAWA